MRLKSILTEAGLAAKILKDPRLAKMLVLAWKHDITVPLNDVASLGPRPSDQDIANLFGTRMDAALANSRYGDVSRDGKFDDWLLRLYVNGHNDYEDITGEGVDALGAWKALSIRGLLKPKDQDFNRFKDIEQIQTVLQRDNDYNNHLRRIQNEAAIEKHKREKSETILINDDRYLVVLPFNYGACYTFNNAYGVIANFCTGSSTGLQWFNRYSPEGPIISVLDKSNSSDINGKWQFHAPTDQIVNAAQDDRWNLQANDKRFADFFPGLMKRIVQSLEQHSDEITTKSKNIIPQGYNIAAAVQNIKNKFPASYASVEPSGAGVENTATGN